MSNQWDFQVCAEDIVMEISAQVGISRLASRLLVLRGIDSVESARSFLNAGLEELSEPAVMSGMAGAVERIKHAIARQEKVAIYGDYDVDGICSTVILKECLERLGSQVVYYVPNRFSEGYGLNLEAMEALARQEVGLLVTVDCGISAVEEISRATSLGVDVIVTDHHTPPPVLPAAVAIINPKIDDLKPTANLAGAGVAYKLALALTAGVIPTAEASKWLELVALATVADQVPLLEENRIMVRYGLLMLAKTERPGLRALLRETGLEGKAIHSWQVGFILAPRLNSAGRMDSARTSIDLLTCQAEAEAAAGAACLCQLNNERRLIEEAIYKEAIAQLERGEGEAAAPIIVVDGEDWHLGVIGIVASRLADTYNRPAIVIAWDGNIGRGSARSRGDFDLYGALNKARKYLLDFGGHRAAAGLRIQRDQLPDLLAILQEDRDWPLVTGQGHKHYPFDLELEEEDVNEDLMGEIDLLHPFGEGNPVPRFVLRSNALSKLKRVGKNQEHLKFQAGKNGIASIAFNRRELPDSPLLDCGQDILFELDRNDFGGKTSLQIKVQDIQATCLTHQRTGAESNYQRLLRFVSKSVQEIGARRPVVFVYPTYRSLLKHQAVMEYFFNMSNVQALHGHLNPDTRRQVQNQLARGTAGIFLLTRSFLGFCLNGSGLPANLRLLVQMWPETGPDAELAQLGHLEIGILERSFRAAFHPRLSGAGTDASRVLVYANLAKTVRVWQGSYPLLHVEAGLMDQRQRKKARHDYEKAGRGIILCDGTHTPGSSQINHLDELILADSPWGMYELAAFTDHLPDSRELEIGVAFDQSSLEFNRNYLRRLYPESDKVQAVWAAYTGHADKLASLSVEELVAGLSRQLEKRLLGSEISAAVRILADLGLYRPEKSGSIMAINSDRAEIARLKLAESPYYMEGLAEQEIYSNWEMELRRAMGW